MIKAHVIYIMIGMVSVTLLIPYYSDAQAGNCRVVANAAFPNNWDTNRGLRKRNGKVLMWRHIKNVDSNEVRSCIVLVSGPDSTGKPEYFISEWYSDEKPFTKWNRSLSYYPNYFVDTKTGMKFGFRDVHLERYDHKPTKNELYYLLQKWHYTFFETGVQIIEAGVDERLWFETFGFIPDKKEMAQIE